MVYTVKQLAVLAGVSTRTLHYYDEIGLLCPSAHGANGYRYYGEEAVLRLQQILFFKELDLSLKDIRTIMDRPDFDVQHALRAHKTALEERRKRLSQLISTVDKTIAHLEGKCDMTRKQYFEGFSEARQKEYEAEIRQRYGERAFDGVTDWNSYSAEQKASIQAESEAIYRDLADAIGMNQGPESPAVQGMIARWHQHMRYFYEPSVERLLGLADLYNDHPDFHATFTRIHPDLPVFMRQAVQYYCKQLKV